MKYRKKPVVIEAVQLTTYNYDVVCQFVGGEGCTLKEATSPKGIEYPDGITTPFKGVYIDTLEGEMLASVGDYIIKGVNGEFYPCKPDIFEKTYEKAE